MGEFNTEQSSLLQVHKARPASFGSLPCLFIGGIRSRITHDMGTRRQDPEVDLYLVDVVSDNVEAVDRLDALTDSLIDKLTANPHAVSGLTLIEPVRGTTTELDIGGVPYAASVVTVSALLQEGRN